MTERVTACGSSVAAALQLVATKMELEITDLDYEVVREQFFTETGAPCGVDTLELIAWKKEKIDTTEVETVSEWLSTLLSLMDIEAVVSFVVQKKGQAELRIASEQGGRIVGRKGSTLRAIRLLLNKFASSVPFEFSIEVDGGERNKDRYRTDRTDKRGPRTSKRDQEKLKNLAVKLGKKVLNSGEELVIHKELSSFERRIVHLAIQEMDGVRTESFMDGEVKRIRILTTESLRE